MDFNKGETIFMKLSECSVLVYGDPIASCLVIIINTYYLTTLKLSRKIFLVNFGSQLCLLKIVDVYSTKGEIHVSECRIEIYKWNSPVRCVVQFIGL